MTGADRSVLVRLLMSAAQFKAEAKSAGRSTDDLTKKVERQGAVVTRTEKDLDRYSGRLRLVGEAAATLGPLLIPLSGAAVTGVAALAEGLVAVGGAAGTMLLALHGVGDGLKALDKYQLDPTADNLEKVRQEFEKLGPSGEHFVRYLDQIEPQLRQLQMTARDGMLPGFEESIDTLLTRAPKVQRIIENISLEVGNLAAVGADNLAGPKFVAFFDYLEHDAAPTLREFAMSTGNVIEGLANMLVAFAPASDSFSSGLLDMTQRYAEWSRGLDENQSFQDFLDYLDRTGPQALDFLGSLTDALVAVTSAAAPWGEVLLPALSGLLDLTSSLANSPLGTPLFTAAAGMIALNRASIVLSPSMGRLSETFMDLRTSPNIAATAMQRFGGAAKMAAGAAGVGLFVASLHESNKTLAAFEGAAGGALAGFAVGGPWGAALGGAIGLVVSMGSAQDDTAERVRGLAQAFDQQTGAITENTRVNAAKDLQDKGLLDSAEQLGLSTSMLTSALLGNAAAQERVNAALAGYDVDNSITSVENLRKSFSDAEIQTILNDRAATKLRDNLPGLTKDWQLAGEQAGQLAGAASRSGVEIERQSLRARQAAARLQELRGAARETAKGFVGLGDDVNNAKVTLDQWLRQLANQAQALENFTANALKAAHRGLDEGLIASLKEAGTAGALRMAQLAGATDAQLDRANKAWRKGQQAIRDYINMEVPPKKVDADTRAAMQKLRALQAQLAQIHDKDVRVNYYINTMRSGGDPELHGPAGSANGSTVPKGGPYVDKHLYLLAPGEEVISNRNGQADRSRPLLKAINAGRLAGGGTAGNDPLDAFYATHTSTGGPSGLSSSASQAASSLTKLSQAAKNELAHRKAALQHEITRDQKALDASQKQLDLDKQRRDAIVAEIRSIREEISARYMSDLFNQDAPQIELLQRDPKAGLTPEQQNAADRAYLEAQAQVNASLAKSPIDILKQDIRDARKAKQLEKQLRKAGIHGDALLYAEKNASFEQMQALINDPSLAKQYQKLYGTRETEARSAGQLAAMQHDGKQLSAIRKTLEADRADRDEDRATLRAAKQHLANLDHNGPERTGAAAARGTVSALNHATGNGLRGN